MAGSEKDLGTTTTCVLGSVTTGDQGGVRAAHTPGPWEFGSGDDYYVRADAYPKTFPHHFKSDDLGDYLAYVGNRTDDFGEANARLIAAAPAMLEQLKRDRLNFLGLSNSDDDACASAARRIGDLIAKAEAA